MKRENGIKIIQRLGIQKNARSCNVDAKTNKLKMIVNII